MKKGTGAKGGATGLLDDPQLSVVAESIFDLKEIRMKEDKIWRMKAVLKTTLPQSFREYSVRLSLNEEPYEERVMDLEKRIAEVEAGDPELFPKGKEKRIAEIRKQIKEVTTELETALDETEVIEFEGVVEELKYKDSDTVVVMMIPDSSIAAMNANRTKFRNYKIELIRE